MTTMKTKLKVKNQSLLRSRWSSHEDGAHRMECAGSYRMVEHDGAWWWLSHEAFNRMEFFMIGWSQTFDQETIEKITAIFLRFASNQVLDLPSLLHDNLKVDSNGKRVLIQIQTRLINHFGAGLWEQNSTPPH